MIRLSPVAREVALNHLTELLARFVGPQVRMNAVAQGARGHARDRDVGAR